MENKVRTKITVLLPNDLIQCIRSFVYNTPGETLQSFIQRSLEKEWKKTPDNDKWQDAVERLTTGKSVSI